MLKTLKEFWQDESGSGGGELIATLLSVSFAVVAGVAIIAMLKGVMGVTFTNMMGYIKNQVNSGF